MIEKTLEIRGIYKKQLISYLQELGGVCKEVSGDVSTVMHDKWACSLSKQMTFRFFQSDVPKVFLTFKAENEETLSTLIKSFRKKTFRAGG
ncbi:hypothetical protein LGQ02_07955 [Bacillus shivajii]|uniref:hypothetical protein n=1 Tax=Bacillus shivajii TaxID=1983719 RepID=UPI001CFB9921|nr:hypothetical protein [Bacillus shivajii]UCZ54670.1 hypothetical protein LGQ02_07955 [Bacillus shivajii]